MLSTDRIDFDKQITVMIGGFPGYFLTPERLESYWRGLQKMQMSMLVRIVDHVLSEQGPEKIPSVSAIWKIYRELRTPATPQMASSQKSLLDQDKFRAFADRRFREFLHNVAGGTSRAALAKMIAEKNRLAAAFKDIDTIDKVSEEEFTRELYRCWTAVHEKQPQVEFDADRRQLVRLGYVTGTEPIAETAQDQAA
jgi:hypothetical protein